jgi:probable HAF family extracellular repeat protein
VEENVKSRTIMWTTVPALLAALVAPLRLAAQEPKREHLHYRLIKLGTFGGPTSYINNVGNGGPYMNRRGMVVGSSMTSIPIPSDQNGFSCPAPPNEVFHAMLWSEDGVTDLGSLGNPSNCSNALGINDRGEVVGTSEDGRTDPFTGVLQIRAVRWNDGRIENLGTFGGNHSFASTINNRGQIVGFALNAVPDNFSLFDLFFGGPSAGTQTRAFLWENGHKRDLHTLGGPDALATFVNDRAQVAGISYTNSTPNSTTGYPTVDPFLWMKDRGMVDLGTLGGTRGLPTGVNNPGQVIGQSYLAGDQTADPFLWDGQKMVDMFTDGIGGNFQIANAINDAGEIVGGAAFPNRISDAALWRHGVITDLGILPGDCFSQAFALNSRGQVVGG